MGKILTAAERRIILETQKGIEKTDLETITIINIKIGVLSRVDLLTLQVNLVKVETPSNVISTTITRDCKTSKTIKVVEVAMVITTILNQLSLAISLRLSFQ